MMSVHDATVVVLACLLPSLAWAQSLPDTTEADLTAETVLEAENDIPDNPDHLIERLDDLRTHPLDLNTASVAELAQLPALSPSLAHRIVIARSQVGAFTSLDALATVEGMTETTLQRVRPYLAIGPNAQKAPESTQRRLRIEGIQRIGRRLDVGRGYDDDTTRTTYAGSPDRLYTRFRVHAPGRFGANLTLEKDPGERLAWEPSTGTYGFDHIAAHLALYNLGPIQTLVVGDYVANFGQGLVLWRRSAFGKGREPTRTLIRTGRGIVPYGSTDENGFFRGLATMVRIAPGLSLSALASRRTLDASLPEPERLTENISEVQDIALTLNRSGLHRTPTERSRKDAVREDLLGAALGLQHGSLHAGLVGYHSRFDRSFQPGTAPHQRFQFRGSRATMIGGYANVFLGNTHIFGEVAQAPGSQIGGLGGVTVRLADRAEVLMLARHYPRAFVSPHGYAFGERNGATTNETGYYVGLQLELASAWRLAAFFDQYRFPWLRFGVPRPSTGHEFLVVVEHRPRSWLMLYLQGRSETKEVGTSASKALGHRLDAVAPQTRQSIRLHADYRFSPQLRLRARLEGVRVTNPAHPDTYGFVLYQDIQWRPFKTLQIDARLAFFDTDTFETRVFTYENDLRYTFSIPALAGRGQRAFVLIQWRATAHLTLQAKASATHFEDVSTVGSGLDAVAGNRLREVRAQLQWRL